jgi:hypothetical protein
MRTSSKIATMAVTALSLFPVPVASAQAAVAGRTYVNGATGRCLAVGRGEVKAGKRVIQWPCKTTSSQAWRRR